MGATIGTGTATVPEHRWYKWGFFYSIFSCMCMFCRSLFVILYFFLAIVLSVLLRFTDSDYLFGIFKLFLDQTYQPILLKGRCGHDGMVVWVKTTVYSVPISYMPIWWVRIKFVNYFRQVGVYRLVLRIHPSIKLTTTI